MECRYCIDIPGSATGSKTSVAEGPYSQNMHAFSFGYSTEGPCFTYSDSGRCKNFFAKKNVIIFSQKHKTTKLGSHTESVKILEFRDNAKLCPVKHLKIYLQQTSSRRKGKQPFQTVCTCEETNFRTVDKDGAGQCWCGPWTVQGALHMTCQTKEGRALTDSSQGWQLGQRSSICKDLQERCQT